MSDLVKSRGSFGEDAGMYHASIIQNGTTVKRPVCALINKAYCHIIYIYIYILGSTSKWAF